MLVVVDTNTLISGLLQVNSKPAVIIQKWKEGKLQLISSELQIQELMRVSRYPKIKERIKPSIIGRLINELRELSIMAEYLPTVDVSPDPYDNYLLSMAEAGLADYLVTGDKRDLLSLKKYKGTVIISASAFIARMK